MKELKKNIWDLTNFNILCITTNGNIKSDGCAVMGAGIALEAKKRYPGIDSYLASLIKLNGNRVYRLNAFCGFAELYSFPTKHNWRDNSDIELIKKSCKELVEICDKKNYKKIAIPRPGCNNGKLNWEIVKKNIEPILDDRFYIVYI